MGCGASSNPSEGNNSSSELGLALIPFSPEGAKKITENANSKKKTGEEGLHELPEEDFINGMLGIDNVGVINEIKMNLESLFIDENFRADDSTLFFSGKKQEDVIWKRPHEMVEEPQMFVNGASRKDVVQGTLGDCWFLSSCSAVAREKKLINRVIPSDQALHGNGYDGMIVCHFWRFGEWVSVYIDDQLPIVNGSLMFAKSTDDNEFWVALLEKAYAKLHGSYEALEGGQSMDALVDLTGGIAERHDIADADLIELLSVMKTSSKNGAFIITSRKGDWRLAQRTDQNGLVEGHAYTVTAILSLNHSDYGKIHLIRIRNPWGDSAEWTGQWSDGDERWNGISEEERKRAAKDADDGEFWMSYDDFCQQFEEVSICRMGPDFDSDGTADYVGQVDMLKGSWISNETAGGSRNDIESFATNPQYQLIVLQPGTLDEDRSGKVNVVIGLMQEHRRSNKFAAIKTYQIGVLIYKALEPNTRLTAKNFMENYEEGSSGTYINYREVIANLELEPGIYVIIPATYNPNSESHFLIRVYSPSSFMLSPLN